MLQPNEITIKTEIKNGQFVGNQNVLAKIIKQFEGMTVEITFKKRKNERSNRQNKYYHGVIVPIWMNIFKVEWGELVDHDFAHDFLKRRFNYTEKVAPETGEVVKIPKSTTDNTVQHQQDYHQKCRQTALEMFNVEIPLPKQITKVKYK
jgi:hypothetical protein